MQTLAHPAHSGAKKGRTMKRLAITLLTAACAAAPLALLSNSAANAQGVSRPANDILLSIGRGQLVTVAGNMTDVFVANEQVADVQVKSSRQLYIFGKAGGETTIYASNAAGDVIWSANVRVGSNIDSVDQMLHMAMPDAKIAVSTMGTNTFLLTGTVAAPEDAAEAQRLVQAFVGKDANVITRLKMATPLQVNLHVKFAEVSRSLIRDIGTNLTSVDGSSGFKFGIGQGRSPTTITTDPNLPLSVGSKVQGYTLDPSTGTLVLKDGTSVTTGGVGSTLAGLLKVGGLDILGALDLGESVGLVSTLSEPNLTALSGETADFLAGGEYPIPVSQGLGTTSIEYKRFGVSLSYTPTVLSNGRISMRVRPEVSELSSQGAITINGFQVPALTVRNHRGTGFGTELHDRRVDEQQRSKHGKENAGGRRSADPWVAVPLDPLSKGRERTGNHCHSIFGPTGRCQRHQVADRRLQIGKYCAAGVRQYADRRQVRRGPSASHLGSAAEPERAAGRRT
jgi:pilus assembly protein CpaC